MLESRMAALAATDAPAAYDPAFTLAVMARIARRRARIALALEGALVVGGSLALATAAPLLAHVSRGALNATGLIAMATLVTAVGLAPAWWVLRRG